jgi:uncharacterized protein YndB with AHSA1/START domain
MRLEVVIDAPRDQVLEALTTTQGLSRWWTTVVTGSATTGGSICFEFGSARERIVMEVVEARPDRVSWHCLEHSGEVRWNGSSLEFVLGEASGGTSVALSHEGVPAELVEKGWRHFLGSLIDYLERDGGYPFGAP